MPTPRREVLARTLQSLAGVTAAPALSLVAPLSAAVTSTLLLECHVAGTTYAGVPDRYEDRLSASLRLELQREPENPADPLAIRVLDPSGRKLGYLPRAKNEVLARLLEAGIPVYAEVVSWERINTWLKIDLRVLAILSA